METDRTVRDAEGARRGSSNARARASENGSPANAAPAKARTKQAGGSKQALAPLYKRLPHGPHGLKREKVAANQRLRICGAMIEAVYQRGYAATSVAQVIELAGVSRRAFYEQFANKEDCFLFTFDSLAAASRERVSRALSGEGGWADSVYAGCRAFLEGVANEPRGSHLMLVEAIGAGPRAGRCLRYTMTAFERVVATGLGIGPDPDAPCLPAPDCAAPELLAPRAFVGGVRFVVARRLREGRQAEIADLTGETVDWIGSYRSSAALARLHTLATVLPPRQTARRASSFPATEDRRARAMAALVELSTQRDYANIADADIARAAGISTEAFHREFDSKQECLLATLDELAADLHDAIQRATRGDEDWPRAACKGVQAVLGYCAVHPELMRLAFLAVFDAGQIAHVSSLLDGFLKTMTKRIPAPERAPNIAPEAIVGAIWAILASYTHPDRLKRLPSLTAHISYLVLAPYIGSGAAVEAIEGAQARPRRVSAR